MWVEVADSPRTSWGKTQMGLGFWPQDVGFDETLRLYTRLPTLPGGCLAQAGDDQMGLGFLASPEWT